VRQICWQGERGTLGPLTQDKAIGMYERLPEQEVAFEVAFPGVKVEDA
jgi:hypothetical protein